MSSKADRVDRQTDIQSVGDTERYTVVEAKSQTDRQTRETVKAVRQTE